MDTNEQISTTQTREIQNIRKENQTFQGQNGEALQQLAAFLAPQQRPLHTHQELFIQHRNLLQSMRQ